MRRIPGKMLKLIIKRQEKTPWALIIICLLVAAGFLALGAENFGRFSQSSPPKGFPCDSAGDGESEEKYMSGKAARFVRGHCWQRWRYLEIANNYQETKGELASQMAFIGSAESRIQARGN